jgi:hypothetical protein
MKMKHFITTMVIAALFALPATAVSVTEITDGPLSEDSLYQIVNTVYGSNGIGLDAGNGLFASDFTSNAQLSSLQFNNDQIFDLLNQATLSAGFIARYAGQTQEFGFYEPADGTIPTAGERTTLLTIDGYRNQTLTDGRLVEAIIGGADLAQSASVGPGTLGFFDNSPADGETYWYSEDAINSDGADHMLALMLNQTFDEQTNLFTSVFLLAFEDLPVGQRGGNLPGDGDYNDLVVEVTFVGQTPFDPPVPEPASMALLGMGLIGFALKKRFTA